MSLSDIETPHKDYAKFKRELKLVEIMMDEYELKRSCVNDQGGTDSYLKKPLSLVRTDAAKEKSLYDNYLEHAFLPEHIVSDAAEEMAGICFKSEPTIKLPEKIAYIEHHANSQGDSLLAVAEEIIRDLLMSKKAPVSTDYLDDRVVVHHKSAMTLLNWRNNSRGYTMMVYAETYTDDDGEEHEQRRHYSIESGELVVTVYRQQSNGQWVEHAEVDDDGVPVPPPSLPNDQPYDYIPIRVAETRKPALLGMARTVHKGFKLSAIYFGTLHGLTPTLVVKSDKEASALSVGFENGIKVGQGDDVGIVQQGTDGAAPQKDAMEGMFNSAIDQGIKLVSESTRAEAANALYLRNANKQIKIDSVASEASKQIEEALRVAAILEGANPDEVEFELDVKLVPEPVAIEELKEMRSAVVESGLIKWSDYLVQMHAHGLIDVEPDSEGALDIEKYIEETLEELDKLKDNQAASTVGLGGDAFASSDDDNDEAA